MSRRPSPKLRADARHGARARPRAELDGDPTPAAKTERRLTALAWVLAAALAVALLAMALGPHQVGDYFTETDFYGAYADGARLIQHGELRPARYSVVGPGYEVALALAGLAVPNLLVAAELLSILATAATLLLWFALLRRRADARVAFVAALFMATNAYFFRYGYAATTDAFAIAIQAAALLLLLTGTSTRAAVAAGVLAACAFLTRYNAVYLAPAGLAIVLLGGSRFVDRRKGALVFAAGFAAPVVPWVLYSLAHGGAVSFQLHHNLAYEVFARARGIPWDDYQKNMQGDFKTLWDVIARDPRAVAGRVAFNVVDHLRLDAQKLLGWPTAIAVALGVLVAARDGSLRRLWPVWLAAVLLFGTLVPVFHSERYSLALLPMYATLAGIAFGSPYFAMRFGPARRAWLKPALVVIPLGAALLASLRVQARTLDQLPTEILECAATLRQSAAPGDRVIARKAHIGFHGGIETLPFPFAQTLGELADYAHAHQARWLFFSWPEAETRPKFFYLLDTAAVVPGLTARRVTHPHPAVLYEIGPEFGRTPAWFANDTLRAWYDTHARLMVQGDDPKLLYRLGGIAWTRGRSADAREPLEAAARLDPKNPAVFLLLGGVLIEVNDIPAAEAAFRRADMLAPGDPRARTGLGWAALAAGRPDRAAAFWRPLLSVTRERTTLERMAEVFARVGDRESEADARRALARLAGTP